MATPKIRDNLLIIQEKIEAAAQRGGRRSVDVCLVGITKGVGMTKIREAVALGITHIGENRIQEARPKIQNLGRSDVTWHLVGNLQRRKVSEALSLFTWMHSIDRRGLLDTLTAKTDDGARCRNFLLEVNVSGEETKHGFSPEEIPSVLDTLSRSPSLTVSGFMTMAPFGASHDTIRRVFRNCRTLRDQESARGRPGMTLTQLSMGMTDDYEIAVEEGATLVRIGRGLFHERG